jgi:hypothetical protein
MRVNLTCCLHFAESLLADSSMSYARSFYYSIATITTTGYGDIVPISSLEHILSCFFIFFGNLLRPHSLTQPFPTFLP